jgi:FkbM family methyltransferase
MKIRMAVISYAQNFEDVLLNRIFGTKQKGFYIDVGAAHPTILSVTKWFYDKGWNGINIEPLPEYHAQLQKERIRDINLNIAVGNKNEIRTFFKSNFFEASSFFYDYAKTAELKIGINHKTDLTKIDVQVKTLKEVCQENNVKEIDFLKIDVEGFEKEVLEGADFKKFRPIIIIIEATEPNSGINPFTIHDNLETNKWEHLLIENNYKRVYFDGLNCFYLRGENYHLHKGFSVPVHGYEFVFPECKIDDLLDYEKIIPKAQFNSYAISSIKKKHNKEIIGFMNIIDAKDSEIKSIAGEAYMNKQFFNHYRFKNYSLKKNIFKLKKLFFKSFLFWK